MRFDGPDESMYAAAATAVAITDAQVGRASVPPYAFSL